MVVKKKKLETQEIEFYKIELGKVLDAMLSLHNLRVQLGGIFATLIFTVIGAALNYQKAGLFFFIAAIQWVFMYLDKLIRVAASFYYLRRAQLQKILLPNDTEAFVGTFYSFNEKVQKKILGLANTLETQERNKAIKSAIGLGHHSFIGFWLPLISSIFDIGLGLYLYLVLGWPLF